MVARRVVGEGREERGRRQRGAHGHEQRGAGREVEPAELAEVGRQDIVDVQTLRNT